MVPISKRGLSRILIPVLAVLLGVVAVFLPVELPISIDAPGRISSQRELSISRGEDGRLVTILRDNRERTIESVSVESYNRNDHVEVSLLPSIRDGIALQSGDTIAYVRSEEAAIRATELQGMRAIEEAQLEVIESGKKDASVRAAQGKVERARLRVEFERRQLERVRALAESGNASASELDERTNALRTAEIDYERAVAALAAMESGAKEQEIAWQRARVLAATDDAEMAARRFADSVIVAPFTGRIATSPDPLTLVALRSVDTAVVSFAVPWKRRGEIAPGQEVRIMLDGLPAAVYGQVHAVGNTVLGANGKQYVEVAATVGAPGADLLPGLYVRCSVLTGQARPLDWISRELFLR